VEEPKTCKSGALMADGGNYSRLRVEALSTSKMEEHWMPSKTLKDKELNSMLEMDKPDSFGRSFISTRRRHQSPRDYILTSDFTATDHSILYQDYQ